MNLAKITQKYVGVPYCLGGKSVDDGLDCFSLLLYLAKENHIEIPDSFEGVPVDNYVSLWNNDRLKAKKTLIRFVQNLGKEIPVGKCFAGDLLILKFKGTGEMSIGMHAGKNLVLTVFIDEGVQLVTMDQLKIKRAYRWV